MNEFYLSGKIPAWLALWGPAMAGAQAQTQPLDVANISDKLTLAYELKAAGSADYAWFYKVRTNGTDTEFSDTLTGSEKKTNYPVITAKGEKETTSPNYDDCAKLILSGIKLTAVTDSDLFVIGERTKPFCIQATGESTLRCKATETNKSQLRVIKNDDGDILLLDGGDAGLNIVRDGDGIYLCSGGATISGILKGKIDVTADNPTANDHYAMTAGNDSSLYVAEDTKIMAPAGKKVILDNSDSRVYSSFLQWRFEVAPESGKRLEIKNTSSNSFDPAIQFTTNGKNRCFAINVVKGTGYTVWLDDNLLMDERKTTAFAETGNKLFTPEGMQFPAGWSVCGETAHVGTDGIGVSVSDTTYTVKTPRGLAWIAWMTNNGKTTANTTTNITNTGGAYYPANADFKDCIVKLANDTSLATPTKGVATGFVNNWVPIGAYGSRFQGTSDGNGKIITGVAIKSTSVDYAGLFGYSDGATV